MPVGTLLNLQQFSGVLFGEGQGQVAANDLFPIAKGIVKQVVHQVRKYKENAHREIGEQPKNGVGDCVNQELHNRILHDKYRIYISFDSYKMKSGVNFVGDN